MVPEALLSSLKQFDEPTLKALSVVASGVGIGVKMFAVVREAWKERAGDRRRAKSLQYAGELAATLAKVEELPSQHEPEVKRMRAALLAEIGQVTDRVEATYPKAPVIQPVIVPDRAAWRRWLLLYVPQRKLALVPQLVFYYMLLVAFVSPVISAEDPEFAGWSVLFILIPCLLIALVFRAWAVAAEYSGAVRPRALWERLTLFYRPQRTVGIVAHVAYWLLLIFALFGVLQSGVETSVRGRPDSDSVSLLVILTFTLVATQQWARLYDSPPAIIEAKPAPEPEDAAVKAAGA